MNETLSVHGFDFEIRFASFYFVRIIILLDKTKLPEGSGYVNLHRKLNVSVNERMCVR